MLPVPRAFKSSDMIVISKRINEYRLIPLKSPDILALKKIDSNLYSPGSGMVDHHLFLVWSTIRYSPQKDG